MWLIRPANFLRKLGSPLLAPFQSTSRTMLSIARTDISFPLAASGGHRSGCGSVWYDTKPESYHIVSRYQVATPSRTITARETGPKVITDSLMRTSSRTPRRLCGVNHRKFCDAQKVVTR